VGIIAGPLVSNGFDPLSWADHDEITKELTRCILAIQVKRKQATMIFILTISKFRSWPSVLNYQSKHLLLFPPLICIYLYSLLRYYMKKEWLTMFMLLVPTMIFMWLISGLFIWWMIPPINYVKRDDYGDCVTSLLTIDS
jgi:NhaP-type Na+/H+ or K+/H+ antiporter